MMPLSEVLAYRTTEDFITAAEHLEAVAAHRESTFFDVRDRAMRVEWEGVSADAMHEQMRWDSQHAAHSADDLREAARVARSGASDVDYAHRRMLYMLQDVQDDEYASLRATSSTTSSPAVDYLSRLSGRRRLLSTALTCSTGQRNSPRPKPGLAHAYRQRLPGRAKSSS
jgi:hypothetical protein